jgi:hypothetical protein
MREAAAALAEQVRLPSLWDKQLWQDLPLDFKPGKYPLNIGILEIGDDGGLRVSYYKVGEKVAAPHLIQGLHAHLETAGPAFAGLAGIQGKLGDWEGSVGKYSQSLLALLKLMTDDAKGRGAAIHFNEETTAGLTRWFILTAWMDALLNGGGHPWIDDSWYQPYENIPGKDLWQARCGAYLIGIAEKRETLDDYVDWHKRLRLEYAANQLVRDIDAEGDRLNQEVQEIRGRLQEFIDTGRLPGKCGLC